MTSITLESIESALDWILEQPMKTNHSSSSTTEVLVKAMSDDQVRVNLCHAIACIEIQP